MAAPVNIKEVLSVSGSEGSSWAQLTWGGAPGRGGAGPARGAPWGLRARPSSPPTGPVRLDRALQLPGLGIQPSFITFTNVTMESDKFICVRETAPQNQLVRLAPAGGAMAGRWGRQRRGGAWVFGYGAAGRRPSRHPRHPPPPPLAPSLTLAHPSSPAQVIIDTSNPSAPQKRPITADSAIMNPASRIIALKAAVAGVEGDSLQIFNLESKAKLKAIQFPQVVAFWKWVSPTTLGLVTASAVYHWEMEGAGDPVKVFDRTPNLEGTQIISYRVDPTAKWCVLVGIAPGAPERPQLVKGGMQLYSVAQGRSQALEAHAAAFSTLLLPGKAEPSPVISFAQKTLAPGGAVVSKLHVIELGTPGTAGVWGRQRQSWVPESAAGRRGGEIVCVWRWRTEASTAG